jgi:large subunit ribosomal protein L4
MAKVVQLTALEELGIDQPNMLHIQESYLRQIAHSMPFTAKKKTKGEVAMTTAKWFRQKGTGRARQGAKSNPHMYGGGRAFPPRPRVKHVGLNKHVRQNAVRSAVLWHIQQGTAHMIKGADFDAFEKTREVAAVLNGLTRFGTICLVQRRSEPAWRSTRNIWNVRQLVPQSINLRDLMEAHYLVFAESALEDYRELLKLRLAPLEAEAVQQATTEVEAQ